MIGVPKHKLVCYEPCAGGAFWEVQVVNANWRSCTAVCHSLFVTGEQQLSTAASFS